MHCLNGIKRIEMGLTYRVGTINNNTSSNTASNSVITRCTLA